MMDRFELLGQRRAAWLLVGVLNALGFGLPDASAAAAEPAAHIELPRGGWRAADPTGEFVQSVNYPASRVNLREGASLAAQIRGHIGAAGKAGAPGLLVVNGVAMPLEADAEGRFQRPYAFARGSNSVEVRAPSGRTAHRVQFLDAGGGTRPRLRVLLSWDSPGTDLDLHVITPAGEHCFYGNRVIGAGGALDVDVTTGYGPEIFATPRPERGVWHVYVNYYGGGRDRALTTAQVAVITDEGLPAETQRTWRVPLRASGDLQHVASFSVL